MPLPPRATYRLQLSRKCTLVDAEQAVPYLSSLGISHLYVSPLLKARAGSEHGYDVTDHTQLNPELGSMEDFRRLVETLRRHDMGLLVDIVPNHLGIFGDDNSWWLDVLENGPIARAAGCFDIDWRPNRASLRDRLLIPVLGDTYGKSLERGDLRVCFDADRGEFSLRYGEHVFPVDPREYPAIFQDEALPAGMDDIAAADFSSLMNAFAQLPSRTSVIDAAREQRYRDMAAHKRRLSRLVERAPEIRALIESVIARINGTPGVAASFDALDRLHEAQAYRLAYWRVAADEINYRRFFDVNSLAALCMSDPRVFEETHAFIVGLVRDGSIDGLRIDHSDGLYDPQQYFAQLRQAVTAQGGVSGLYVVTEKILAAHERLRESWAVQGTTGYEFSALVTAWLVDAPGERSLTRTCGDFVGRVEQFEDVAYAARKLVMRILLSPEIETLATQLDRIAQADRHTADFTRAALREALMEVIACFPVYRTYIGEAGASAEDAREVDRAVAMARRRSLAADTSVFDFLREVMLGAPRLPGGERQRAAMREFAMKFQQVSAPVMAKGVEDTALYRFNRLVCLNDVGSDPRRFGVPPSAVHQANADRLRHWPHSMLATSTHDSKRSEDVRARLAVLSELPVQWRRHVARWSRLNRSKRTSVNDSPVPDRDDEYLIYQSLLGLWEADASTTELLPRLQEYVVKAAREAKRATSWRNVDSVYEEGLVKFVERLLERRGRSAFLHDFGKLASIVSYFGHCNSLSQVLLKLTSPGVPDIYQGCENPFFALVDPDNRRGMDLSGASHRLTKLQQTMRENRRSELLPRLLAAGHRGDAKLFLTSEILNLRARRPALFADGTYEPLIVAGSRESNLLAFRRTHGSESFIAVISRGSCSLMNAVPAPPVADVWRDTRIEVGEAGEAAWTECLSGRTVEPTSGELDVAEVLADWPVAMLLQTAER